MQQIFKDLTELQGVGEGVFINDTHMLKVYPKAGIQDMEALEGSVKALTGKVPELRLEFCKQEHIGVVYKGNFKNP